MLNDDLIKKIDNLIDSGVKVPGFGKKVMLDTAKIDRFIKEVTDLVPQDIQEAKEIINQKNSILAQANMEAQRIIESANRDSVDISSKGQDKFEKLVNEKLSSLNPHGHYMDHPCESTMGIDSSFDNYSLTFVDANGDKSSVEIFFNDDENKRIKFAKNFFK